MPSNSSTMRLAGDTIVALHESWATQPLGTYFGDPACRRAPKIVAVRFDSGEAVCVDDLISGFQMQNGYNRARLVGLVIGPDETICFSSDSQTEGLFRLRIDLNNGMAILWN